jgi:hypothetical protein
MKDESGLRIWLESNTSSLRQSRIVQENGRGLTMFSLRIYTDEMDFEFQNWIG